MKELPSCKRARRTDAATPVALPTVGWDAVMAVGRKETAHDEALIDRLHMGLGFSQIRDHVSSFLNRTSICVTVSAVLYPPPCPHPTPGNSTDPTHLNRTSLLQQDPSVDKKGEWRSEIIAVPSSVHCCTRTEGIDEKRGDVGSADIERAVDQKTTLSSLSLSHFRGNVGHLPAALNPRPMPELHLTEAEYAKYKSYNASNTPYKDRNDRPKFRVIGFNDDTRAVFPVHLKQHKWKQTIPSPCTSSNALEKADRSEVYEKIDKALHDVLSCIDLGDAAPAVHECIVPLSVDLADEGWGNSPRQSQVKQESQLHIQDVLERVGGWHFLYLLISRGDGKLD
ncbi:hypothetical protein C8R45DRAFT_920246 [Mycena sanguinolenta]|nr:hypothetical protein C8R45DRAFT_920246 [Mycena sanguinolenta]